MSANGLSAPVRLGEGEGDGSVRSRGMSACGVLTPRLALAVMAAAAVVFTAGCGGSSSDAIRIGILFDCEQQFATGSEQFMAGAELPLVARGARLRGTLPSKGIEKASVAGRTVELVTQCVREFSRASTVAALRLLVEKDGADIVVLRRARAPGTRPPGSRTAC